MAFDQSVCEVFVDECDVKYTPAQLFQMIVGVDGNGCPVLKTKNVGNAGLQNDFETAASMAALKIAMDAWVAANPTKNITHSSTFADGASYTTHFFYT